MPQIPSIYLTHLQSYHQLDNIVGGVMKFIIFGSLVECLILVFEECSISNNN